ncbi:MAG: hypothetical protein IJT49_00745 [Clostridia bacterium]|nr:hypothetical protein [Clostridia bacterium]
MKKNELLYRAIGDIKDKTVADAYNTETVNGKGYRVRTAFSVAAAVIAVAGLFAFSAFLLRFTVKDNTGSAATETGKETAADQSETKIKETEQTEAVTEPVYEPESGVKRPTLEEFYNIYPYSELLPKSFPPDFELLESSRSASSNIGEAGYITLVKNTDGAAINANGENNKDLYKRESITVTIGENDVYKNNKTIRANSFSEESIKDSLIVYEDPWNDGNFKLGMTYSGYYYTDKYAVSFRYNKYLPADESGIVTKAEARDYDALFEMPGLSAIDLFNMITSAQYFKTHPISDLGEKEPVRPYYEGEINGIALTLEFGSDKYSWLSLINVTATLKNNTDHEIQIYRPVISYDIESHTEISLDIYRPDNTSVRLKDIDTYDVPFDTAESWLALAPGEEYVQKMRFTGDRQSFGEQGAIERDGYYNVDAAVSYTEGTNDIRHITFGSQIVLGSAGEYGEEGDAKYNVAEKVDFSKVGGIARAQIRSGITGDTQTVEGEELDKLVSAIGSITASDPVSSRGYCGFYYNVKLYDDQDRMTLDVSFAPDGRIQYSKFEKSHGFIYKAMYKADDTEAFNELKNYIDSLF